MLPLGKASICISSVGISDFGFVPIAEFRVVLSQHHSLYSLVTMDVTRLQMTNVPREKAKGILGPMNEFHHFRAFPDVNFKTVVRPNFDTLYSVLWADMTKAPIIVSVPDSGGRYYLLPMLDMWLYAPERSVLDGTWKPPVLQHVSGTSAPCPPWRRASLSSLAGAWGSCPRHGRRPVVSRRKCCDNSALPP
jgi:hypothetical protein